jgi:hypothetical protein
MTCSEALAPGMCACISARPGMRYLPRASTRTAPAGTATLAVGPTAAIRPSRTITVCLSSTRSRSIGTTFTSTNATGCAAAGCAAAALPTATMSERASPKWRARERRGCMRDLRIGGGVRWPCGVNFDRPRPMCELSTRDECRRLSAGRLHAGNGEPVLLRPRVHVLANQAFTDSVVADSSTGRTSRTAKGYGCNTCLQSAQFRLHLSSWIWPRFSVWDPHR